MRSLAVATITWARSGQESELLLASLRQLSELNLPMYATDAGSLPEFLAEAARIPNLDLVREGATLVQQVKCSVRRAIAAGHDTLLYTEPDKREFFTSGAKAFLDSALKSPDAAVAVAARDDASFATFPAYQHQAEHAFNQLASGIFANLPHDLLYGPLVLHTPKVARYIEQAGDHLAWGWRTYLFARCSLASQPITEVTGDFACPPAQRGEDDPPVRVYRLAQLRQNIEGLQQALRDAQST